jgi:Flp pilus assembly protein TadD
LEIRKVLMTQPGSVPGRLLKSTIDAQEKNFAAAESELTALLKEQPGNPAVQQRMGLYYELRGQAAEAEKSLTRALELRADSNEMLQSLVMFYVGQKQPDRAIGAINKVAPDSKKQVFHYELMGQVYSRSGRLQEAEAAYQKALQVDPERSLARNYLAQQYMQSGRLDDALGKVDEILKKTPNNAAAYTTKGSILLRKGDVPGAKDNYSQALKINPNSFEAANNLAFLLAEDGRDLELALNHAQTARRLDSENPDAADTLGWVQYKLGRNVLARDQLKFAVSKKPDNPVFQYHLGMIYKETKQNSEAEAALRKAVASKEEFKEKPLADAALKELSRR